ncbi:MAG: hypothetical protein KDB40_05045 [Acidimicrobiales bacterium]|nr:hypothetical protein [Acidimicrobiales bacterium]MCB9394126.1 hypothetical protein [Acidimicrobiaceae bacterium]
MLTLLRWPALVLTGLEISLALRWIVGPRLAAARSHARRQAASPAGVHPGACA